MQSLRNILLILGIITSPNVFAIVADRLDTSEPEGGFGGHLYSDFSLSSGNVDLITWGAGGGVGYSKLFANKKITQSSIGIRGETYQAFSKGQAFARSYFASISSVHMLSESFGGFSYLQYESIKFQSVKARVTTGLGATVTFMRVAGFTIWASAGPMFEQEDVDNEGRHQITRAATHMAIRYISEDRKIGIQTAIYYQPKLDQVGDFRLLSASELELGITKKFSFYARFELSYDNQPPVKVKDQDILLRNGFKWRF